MKPADKLGLRNLVASADWRNMAYSRGANAVVVKDTIQGTAFWEDGRELILGMEPLVRLLRIVDGDGSTSGYIYEAVHRARKSLQTRCLDDPVRYITIWNLFEGRVKNWNLLHVVHAAAMYLNPCFMYDGKISYSCEDVQNALLYVGEKMIDITERGNFAKELLDYDGKHPKIFSFLSIAQMRSVHPRVWWEANGSCVPLLKRVAVRLLSQPCSASPCERNWSAFDAAQTKKRNKLTPAMLEDLVYIRVNSLMLKNSVNFELQDRKPIILTLEDLAEMNPEVVDEHLDEAEEEAFMEVDPIVDTGLDQSWLERLNAVRASNHAHQQEE